MQDIGNYALSALNMQDQISLHESTCRQYLIFHKPPKSDLEESIILKPRFWKDKSEEKDEQIIPEESE